LSRLLRTLAGFALAAIAILATAGPAAAHAVLESSDPADGSRLTEAPDTVTLTFNEDVGAEVGGVRVFDAGGERVDDGVTTVAGPIVSAGLNPGLGDGAYIVTYRVLSADGHPVRGAFSFVVGEGEAASGDVVAGLLGEDDDRPWEIAGAVARGLAYAGALAAAGLAAFLVLAHDGGAEGPRLRRFLAVAAGVGAFGALVQLPITAALATGLGVDAITETGVLGQVLGESVALSLVVVLSGLALLVLVPAGRDEGVDTVPAAGPVVLVAAALAAGGFAIAGHTATTDPRWLVSLTDAVHTCAGAVWFGGLVGLGVVLRARRADPAASGAASVVARFSGMAAIALLVVAAAGVALSWTQVRSLDALTSTTYGRLLIAKVAIVAVVAAIGAWNRFRLVPAVESAPKAATRRLRHTVGAEALAIVVAVGLTAVLVQVTPARASVTAPFSDTVPLGDGTVNVVVDPARVGPTSIHLYLLDASGQPFEPESVTLDLSLESADIGPLEREPFVAGPGHFQLDTSDLSIAGTWTITVDARTSRFDEATASVEVPIRP
jgi:copper transport protein